MLVNNGISPNLSISVQEISQPSKPWGESGSPMCYCYRNTGHAGYVYTIPAICPGWNPHSFLSVHTHTHYGVDIVWRSVLTVQSGSFPTDFDESWIKPQSQSCATTGAMTPCGKHYSQGTIYSAVHTGHQILTWQKQAADTMHWKGGEELHSIHFLYLIHDWQHWESLLPR